MNIYKQMSTDALDEAIKVLSQNDNYTWNDYDICDIISNIYTYCDLSGEVQPKYIRDGNKKIKELQRKLKKKR